MDVHHLCSTHPSVGITRITHQDSAATALSINTPEHAKSANASQSRVVHGAEGHDNITTESATQ